MGGNRQEVSWLLEWLGIRKKALFWPGSLWAWKTIFMTAIINYLETKFHPVQPSILHVYNFWLRDGSKFTIYWQVC